MIVYGLNIGCKVWEFKIPMYETPTTSLLEVELYLVSYNLNGLMMLKQ